MLYPGQPAPEFSLTDHNSKICLLSELIAIGPIVLYFYPADFTFVCSREACMFRDIHQEMAASGIRVFGVSPQDAHSHKKFRNELNLPFALLSDPTKKVIAMYGALAPLGMVKRITYWIGADGLVKEAVSAFLSVKKHQEMVERILKAGDLGEAKRVAV